MLKLTSTDTATKEEAERVLLKHADISTPLLLNAIIEDEYSIATRVTYIRFLGKLQPEEGVPQLVALLVKTEIDSIRDAVKQTLVEYGVNAVPFLIKSLDTDRITKYGYVIEILSRQGKETIPLLIKTTNAENARIRLGSYQVLYRKSPFDENLRKALYSGLKDSEPEIKAYSLIGLAKDPKEEAWHTVQKFMEKEKDKEIIGVYRIADVIHKNRENYDPALLEIYLNDNDPLVYRVAFAILKESKNKLPLVDIAKKVLPDSTKPESQAKAIRFIGMAIDTLSVSIIKQYTRNSNQLVKLAAIDVLREHMLYYQKLDLFLDLLTEDNDKVIQDKLKEYLKDMIQIEHWKKAEPIKKEDPAEKINLYMKAPEKKVK
ncbi:MAG: hypothetical protein JXA60_06700 [Candidatus Coatesbacteria bacterium]|nr:hypothetical protein [Candidatus Coatesbacteria bacterium]